MAPVILRGNEKFVCWKGEKEIKVRKLWFYPREPVKSIASHGKYVPRASFTEGRVRKRDEVKKWTIVCRERWGKGRDILTCSTSGAELGRR